MEASNYYFHRRGKPAVYNKIEEISPRDLAKKLKELERNEIVKREVTADYPVTITMEEYANTLKPLHKENY